VKLKDIGEFGFIDKIKHDALIREYLGLVGIGDDCAVFRVEEGKSILLTTDMLLERVHFLREVMTPYQIGYKALAANLSDIAASGGLPKEAFVSIAVPEDLSLEELLELYDGMKELARKFDVNITGGDTTTSLQDLVINIALTGEIEEDLALYRSGAKAGDYICVTGFLGDSAAGLDLILNHRKEMHNFPQLIKQHFTPIPHIEQGRAVSRSRLANSMMDISDGLASDIRHISKASKLGAILYEERFPHSEEFQKYLAEFNPDYLKTAIGVGEDYCLLLTVSQQNYARLKEVLNNLGHQFYNVGEMAEGEEIHIVYKNGRKAILELSGWDQFKEH